MAICRICKQEMTTAAGCSASLVTIVESVFSVSPKKYERIRFASERDSLPGIHQRCPSCGALPGYFHHWDCDAERCPVCREAPLFCICEESYIEICDIPTEERGGKNE